MDKNNKIDPYKVFNLKQDFDIEELRTNFKKLALKVHPDKGGSEQAFNLVVLCYKKLNNEYKLRESNRQYNELKNDFKNFEKEQNNNQYHNTNMKSNYDNNGQFHKDFNETFDKYKVSSVYDNGYGNIMNPHSDVREEIKINNNMGKYNVDKFNNQFDKIPINNQKKIIKYADPEALISIKNIGYSELGLSTIDDFSGENDTSKKLNYTDYMKAYTTTRLVDPNLVSKRKEYKNIDDIEKDRSNIEYKMTDKDLQKIEKIKRLEEKKERERLKHLQAQDELYNNQFNRVNKAMLKYCK